MSFEPAWWLRNRHLQTIWGKLARRLPPLPLRLERWDTPDGDFLDLYRLSTTEPHKPHIVILHGLEGSVRSHYAQGMLHEAHRNGWSGDLVIWRSCGDNLNKTRRFYHSGETTDLAFVLQKLIGENSNRRIGVSGVSLGGNVLLKYLGDNGSGVPPNIFAAAAVSVPFDLGAGADSINHGFSKVYQRYFLKSLKRKAVEKLETFPDLIPHENPAGRIDAINVLREFDDVCTAPIHGFVDANDYYNQASSIHSLSGIRVPTLLLNAVDDPFLPESVLDEVRAIATANSCLQVDFPAHGGHAGFVGGKLPWRPEYYLEKRVFEFLNEQL